MPHTANNFCAELLLQGAVGNEVRTPVRPSADEQQQNTKQSRTPTRKQTAMRRAPKSHHVNKQFDQSQNKTKQKHNNNRSQRCTPKHPTDTKKTHPLRQSAPEKTTTRPTKQTNNKHSNLQTSRTVNLALIIWDGEGRVGIQQSPPGTIHSQVGRNTKRQQYKPDL